MNTATLKVRTSDTRSVINPNIYGHFAEHLGGCIYGGFWVGEDSLIPNTRGIRNDVVDALKKLSIPVLRWPGGCFADEYHWQDGIGPRENRPSMINTHWGGTVENNHFGTHEFMDLCSLLETEPYICGNVGSGSPQEMMNWVEYLTSDGESPMANLRRQNGRAEPWKLTYFGVGNESWGCGGNMRPEYYADEYRRYNTFVKNYGKNKVYRIACGANDADYNWTAVLMERAGRQMNGLSLHYYTISTGDWGEKGSATAFNEAEYHETLRRTLFMGERIAKHGAAMDRHDPEKKVGMVIDEWGIWTDVEPGTNPGFLYQQNSLRDAILAALNFHIFHDHADRVTMTNIAQTVNVLQAMILTEDEKMVLTPTYHVFEMFKGHQGATVLTTELSDTAYTVGANTIPAVSASASRAASGDVLLTLVNTDPNNEASLSVEIDRGNLKFVSGRVLTADAVTTHNTFDAPYAVKQHPFDTVKQIGLSLQTQLPPRSVVSITLR